MVRTSLNGTELMRFERFGSLCGEMGRTCYDMNYVEWTRICMDGWLVSSDVHSLSIIKNHNVACYHF